MALLNGGIMLHYKSPYCQGRNQSRIREQNRLSGLSLAPHVCPRLQFLDDFALAILNVHMMAI